MNYLKRLMAYLGVDSSSEAIVENDAVREAIDAGQRAKRAENYDQALEIFERALELAKASHDYSASAVIMLHQAETLVRLGQWENAETLLLSIKQSAQNTSQRTQLAYAFNGLGFLAQSQGHWPEARNHYERAREIGRDVGAAGAEGRALGHLADTYLYEGNASYAVHLLREALPKLNISGDLELGSYLTGQLGQALIATGQEAEGQQLLIRALRIAEQMRHRENERRWALVLAERSSSELRYSDAYTRYKQALRLFDRTKPTPEYVTALCQMGKVCLQLQEFDEALEYTQRAVETSGGMQDGNITTLSQGTLGMALRAAGRSASAIKHLAAAVEAYEKMDAAPENTTGLTETLRNLAAAQADVADEATAIKTYQRAIEKAKTLDSGLELAQAYRDLGMLYAKREDMPAAIQAWTAGLEIYEQGKHYTPLARLYCDIAGARKYLGQGPRAMKDYEQALMILNSVDDWVTRGLVLSNAANAYADHGDIESADSFFNESITIARRMGDLSGEATRRGNYGWFLLATGRPQQAISTLEHALRMSRQLGLDLQIAVQTDNLGLAYDSLGDFQTALRHHEQAINLIDGLQNLHWEASFKINEANTLVELGQFEAALELFEQALEHGQSTSDAEVIIRSLTGLACIALAQHQPEKAEDHLNRAIAMARRADMRRYLAEALRVRSQQQAALNQPEKSSALWEEAQKLFKMLHTPQAKMRPAWLKDH